MDSPTGWICPSVSLQVSSFWGHIEHSCKTELQRSHSASKSTECSGRLSEDVGGVLNTFFHMLLSLMGVCSVGAHKYPSPKDILVEISFRLWYQRILDVILGSLLSQMYKIHDIPGVSSSSFHKCWQFYHGLHTAIYWLYQRNWSTNPRWTTDCVMRGF